MAKHTSTHYAVIYEKKVMYRKTLDEISKKFNENGEKIIENKGVVNRMFVNGRSSCFIITLKNHQPNF